VFIIGSSKVLSSCSWNEIWIWSESFLTSKISI
jgi:hypothetical protein